MMTSTDPALYKRHRCPTEIIAHAMWLYFRFTLSYRDVEELLAARSITVSYETVRQWCLKFGQLSANQLRHRRPQTADKWFMDEVFLKINGVIHYLWRAVDQFSNVLDILVTSRRDQQAAKRCFCTRRKGCKSVPRGIITAKCRSDGAAKREIWPGVEHRQHKGLTNRAENSYQPTRQKERQMRRFQAGGHAQRFLSAWEPRRGHFWLRRHTRPAGEYRAQRAARFMSWNKVTSVQVAV